MPDKQDFATRLINLYSNRYVETKIAADLKRLLTIELKKVSADYSISLPHNIGKPPVILLGMHRSGTTLVSKLLRKSGIYMGRLRGEDTDESLYFQNVNKAVLSMAGGHWDNPEPLTLSLENETFRVAMVNVLGQYCLDQRKTKSYGHAALFSMPELWGWKDPRTCFTLPLWMKVFPEARVVYIQRNGVDVAQSLMVRNQKVRTKQPFSPRTEKIVGAFGLWEVYNKQCLKEIRSVDSKHLHIVRYEELLADPDIHLQRLFSFLGHDQPQVPLSRLSEDIEQKRAFAFTKNADLVTFYKMVRNTDLMKELGYADII